MKLQTFLSAHSTICLDHNGNLKELLKKQRQGPIIHSPIGNNFYIENNPEKTFTFFIKEENIDEKDLLANEIYGEIKCVIKKRFENGKSHFVFIIVNLKYYKKPTPQIEKGWKLFITQLVRQRDEIEELSHCEEVSIVFNEKLTHGELEFFSRFLNVRMKMKKSFISIVNKKYNKPDLYDQFELKLCHQNDLPHLKALISNESRALLGQKIAWAIKSNEVYLIKKRGTDKILGMFRIRKKSISLKDVQKQNESLKFCIQMVPLINFENKIVPKKNIETLYISDFYLREDISDNFKVEITRNVFYRLMNNKYFAGTHIMSLPEYTEWLKECTGQFFSVNIDSFIYNLTKKI